MTTRLRIENAGPSAVNVRTMPTDDAAGHNAATRLNPGQASEFFYVHQTQILKIEEIPGSSVLPEEPPTEPVVVPVVDHQGEPHAPPASEPSTQTPGDSPSESSTPAGKTE